MDEETVEHVIWREENRGGYVISIIARLKGPSVYNVQYLLRLENPDDQLIDHMLTLDGFKELGKLCSALGKFCEDPIVADETQIKKLQKLLTVENILNYVTISKMQNKRKPK